MLLAARISQIPFQPPWELSFEDRVADLAKRERRIAYFYEKPDTSTFRYRVFNMVAAINSAPELGISASWFTLADLRRADRFIDQADVLVVCRTRYDAEVNRMIGRARARKIPILFDIDDFVFDTGYIPLILDALDLDLESQKVLDSWFASIGRIGATLRLCDGAITTNRFLAERIQVFDSRIVPKIVPNFLNRLQQEQSEVIWKAKQKSHFARDKNIHIGYFSGTPTHNHDFQIASSALAKLLDTDPRIVIRVVGFLATKGPMSRHADRIQIHPLQDFLNLQRLIGEVEVNIAPVQNNIFSNCKSELKFFEAASVGTLTIASPTFAFRNSIRDGENGLLASAHEWQAKLEVALDKLAQPEKYAEIVDFAHTQAVERFGWDCFATRIAEAVFGGQGDGDSSPLDAAQHWKGVRAAEAPWQGAEQARAMAAHPASA